MGRWIKHYHDGTTYTGEDNAISQGKASWQNSSNILISRVDLYHDIFSLSIRGLGEYWQSDSFEAQLLGQSKPIKRRIERQIEPRDLYFYLNTKDNSLIASFENSVINPLDKVTGRGFRINPQDTGKWLILELDLTTYFLTHYISKVRI